MASAIIAPESLTSAADGNEHEIQERRSTVGSHLRSRHWRRRSFSFGRNSTGLALISRRRVSRLNVDDFLTMAKSSNMDRASWSMRVANT